MHRWHKQVEEERRRERQGKKSKGGGYRELRTIARRQSTTYTKCQITAAPYL